MFCRRCGKEVIGEEEFCEECKQAMGLNAKVICPFCGKETPKEEMFCKHCEGYLGNLNHIKNEQTSSPKAAKTQKVTETKVCQSCRNVIPKNSIYCPICKKMADTQPVQYSNSSQGSYGAGWALGFFLGLIGLIIGLCIDKSETKRGAIAGFIVAVVLSFIVTIFGVGCVMCSVNSYMGSI